MKESDKGSTATEWVERARAEHEVKKTFEAEVARLNNAGLSELNKFLQRFQPKEAELKKPKK